MNFLGCDEIFFLRFLPSGGRFEELKYRWRRQEKREGEPRTNHKLQFRSSLRINKMPRKRARERGLLHADVLQGDVDEEI